MAKQRYINTRFWIDDYISNLDPIEKLMFLYLLSNQYTEISGVYEIPLKTIATDTGLDKEMVIKIIKRFEKEKKVKYKDGWIAISNFIKHQSAENPKIKRGIELSLSLCPDWCIAYVYPIDTLSHSNTNTNTNTNSNTNTNTNINTNSKETSEVISGIPNGNQSTTQLRLGKVSFAKLKLFSEETSQDIPEIIKAFEVINPACSRFYGNKTQRTACQDLIDSYSFERVLSIIEKTLPRTNGLEFFPTITTPLQLRDKWASLESAVKKKQSEITSKKDKYQIV